MSYLVEFHDLSAYGPNVVFVPNAPVVDSIVVDDAAEAFEYVVAFSDDFQISMTNLDPS